jgi:hypothetical protein
MSARPHTFPLTLGLAGIAAAVLLLLAVGLGSAGGKPAYDLVRDLFVPLIGPLVAVLIPVVLFFVIPHGQTRQKLALDLCTHYYTEEMRDARNVGWRHFVTEQRKLPEAGRAERLRHFLDYLTSPEVHRAIDPVTDAVYQKASRVLDYFALVNGCLARGSADADMVRDFLLFYYLWWRDEIMDPLRAAGPGIGEHPKVRPVWWPPMTHLDALAGPDRFTFPPSEVPP